MSMFDFSNAPTDQGGVGDTIPEGTLAWAILTVRPHNLAVGAVLTPSKSNPDNRYLDCELTILEGPYARRKVWHMIGLEGSDKWVAQGMSSVRHILEVGRVITNFAAGEPKYRLNESLGERAFMELNELRCAVKLGIEKQEGYEAKNRVKAFLSPNPTSNTHKDFMRLVSGDTAGPAPVAKPAGAAWGAGVAAAPARPAWGAGAAAQPQHTRATPQAAPTGRPSWAGPADGKKLDDDIPF